MYKCVEWIFYFIFFATEQDRSWLVQFSIRCSHANHKYVFDFYIFISIATIYEIFSIIPNIILFLDYCFSYSLMSFSFRAHDATWTVPEWMEQTNKFVCRRSRIRSFLTQCKYIAQTRRRSNRTKEKWKKNNERVDVVLFHFVRMFVAIYLHYVRMAASVLEAGDKSSHVINCDLLSFQVLIV